jgi:Sensory domain in DIguanylate Cyclases and Two-component system
MDWTYPWTDPGLRAEGIARIAERLVTSIGDDRLAGTRFTYDVREMLRATREIEATQAAGGSLWVGFQNAAKLEHEAERYAAMTAAGARVIAFGTGVPDMPEQVALRWVELAPTTDRLENQWFLVATAPEPIAFVSWEVSEPVLFGRGGINAPHKQFVGFVTDDRRVIAMLTSHLEGVAGTAVMT